MKLSELAFACYVYAKMDEDDSSYSRFCFCQAKTDPFDDRKCTHLGGLA